jgi:hypothetical protein
MSPIGYATLTMCPTRLSDGSSAAGRIRNTQDSSPRPVVMVAASIVVAHSRRSVRSRISRVRPAASAGYSPR